MNQLTVVEEIHTEFDTAAERMLAEAQTIISTGYNADKEHRLQALGFAKSKQFTDYEKAQELSRLISHYKQNYPAHKFITEDAVKSICKKYNLILGPVSNFIGDVPEKNLAEIEAFVVKEEDYKKPFSWMDMRSSLMFNWFESSSQRESQLDRLTTSAADFETSTDGLLGLLETKPRRVGVTSALENYYAQALHAATEKKLKEPVKPVFEICAPEKDFNTQNMKKKGYKLVPEDPIVLCPVHSGFLIVSKWGLEASDPSVLDERMN